MKPIRSKSPKVYKSSRLNNANFGELNLTDYQVFLHLVSMIGKVDEFGKYLQENEIGREYSLTAKAYSEMFRIHEKTAYTTIKKAVDKLMETSILVEEKLAEGKGQIVRINICEKARYIENEGYISVKFTESIMPHLIQVKNRFVIYNLQEITGFRSIYTTRLYELIQEFKDTGYVIKSVAQLREFFGVGDKFAEYGHFKSRTFKSAVEEINSKTNYDLKFNEIKEKRSVTAIEFTFKRTEVKSVILPDGTKRNHYKKPVHKPTPE